jgi:hypothetical protein
MRSPPSTTSAAGTCCNSPPGFWTLDRFDMCAARMLLTAPRGSTCNVGLLVEKDQTKWKVYESA